MSPAVEPAAVDEPLPVRRGLRRVGRPKLAERLAEQAAEAADLRALATNPDVVALRVERIRRQVDVMAWSGIVLGLGFTMVNVQTFAARGAAPWSLPWSSAWLLDPMVSLFVIALLRTQQVCARWQVRPGPWVRRGVWAGLAATYAMNTWTAWVEAIPSLVLLHSVPVVVVAMGAEALTDAREALTQAILVAARTTGPPEPPAAAAQPPTPAQADDQPPAEPPAQAGGERAGDVLDDRTATSDVDDPPTDPDGLALPPALGGSRRRLPARGRPAPGRARRQGPALAPRPAGGGGPEVPSLPAAQSGDDELVARLQRVVDQRGAVPSRDQVKAELGVGSSVANRIRARVRAPQPLASTNGAHR